MSSRPSSSTGTQSISAPTRSASCCQGTMLEWCSISVSTMRSPSPTLASPQARATRLIASVALRTKIDLAAVGGAEVVGDRRPGALVGGGRLGRERVRAAVDVGVVARARSGRPPGSRPAPAGSWRRCRGRRPAGRGPRARAPGRRRGPSRSGTPRRAALVVVVGSMVARQAVGARLDLLADPAVALLLELADQLRAALLDDPALEHDVDEVGLDHVQDALVVGDDQDAHVGAGELVDALGDGAQRVDVEAGVGLVEDRDLRPQQRQLQQLHALLLAAGEAVVEVAAGEVFGDVGQRHRLLGDLGEVLELDLGLRRAPRGGR